MSKCPLYLFANPRQQINHSNFSYHKWGTFQYLGNSPKEKSEWNNINNVEIYGGTLEKNV